MRRMLCTPLPALAAAITWSLWIVDWRAQPEN